MKNSQLIRFLIYFVIAVVVLDFVGSLVFNQLYKVNRHGQSGGNINYYLNMDRPDILVMGSSRAQHTVIPDSIGNSCFNLSHNGMEIGFHVALLDILAQQNALPNKKVLLQIEKSNFTDKSKSLIREISYLKYYHPSNEVVQTNIDSTEYLSKIKYLFGTYKYNGIVLSLLKNNFFTTLNYNSKYDGFVPIAPDPMDSARTVSSDTDPSFPIVKDQSIYQKSYGHLFLNHALDICKKNDVELVLFTAPYYTEKGGSADSSFSKYLQGLGIKYLDFSYDENGLLSNPGLWKDRAHLNMTGAQLFSSELNKKLNYSN